jgi:hypothetical protein
VDRVALPPPPPPPPMTVNLNSETTRDKPSGQRLSVVSDVSNALMNEESLNVSNSSGDRTGNLLSEIQNWIKLQSDSNKSTAKRDDAEANALADALRRALELIKPAVASHHGESSSDSDGLEDPPAEQLDNVMESKNMPVPAPRKINQNINSIQPSHQQQTVFKRNSL